MTAISSPIGPVRLHPDIAHHVADVRNPARVEEDRVEFGPAARPSDQIDDVVHGHDKG